MQDNWFDAIPQGWKIKQCRQIFKIHNGATPKSSEPDYWGDEITWITPEDLGNNFGKNISETRRKITKEGYENCGTSIASAGSIALSTRAPIGHIAVTSVPACVNQGCRLLEPKEGDVNYWYYALSAAKPVLISRGQGTTFMELPRQSLASVRFPVPPLEMQYAIASFLDFKTAQIDALIDAMSGVIDSDRGGNHQSMVSLLHEYRSALITNAVIGKIDVSGFEISPLTEGIAR